MSTSFLREYPTPEKLDDGENLLERMDPVLHRFAGGKEMVYSAMERELPHRQLSMYDPGKDISLEAYASVLAYGRMFRKIDVDPLFDDETVTRVAISAIAWCDVGNARNWRSGRIAEIDPRGLDDAGLYALLEKGYERLMSWGQ